MKPWPLLCALCATASGVVWQSGQRAHLVWRAADWSREPWTLWTAHWVHLSAAHWLANLLALVAVAVLGLALRAGWIEALALLLAWPLSTLALLGWPQVGSYHGLSGLVHAAVGVLFSLSARRAVGSPMTLVLGTGLALKLALERGWSQPLAYDPSWGFNVVYAAHLSGALAGAACGLLAGLVFRRPAA